MVGLGLLGIAARLANRLVGRLGVGQASARQHKKKVHPVAAQSVQCGDILPQQKVLVGHCDGAHAAEQVPT